MHRKHVDDPTMSIGDITMTENIKCKVVYDKDLLFINLVKGGEQGTILSHVISATRVNYPLILWSLS